jgi:hypothetical protein
VLSDDKSGANKAAIEKYNLRKQYRATEPKESGYYFIDSLYLTGYI